MHQSTLSFKNTLSGPSVQDIDTFRQRNFYQWVFTGPLGYCQSHSGWSFLDSYSGEPTSCVSPLRMAGTSTPAEYLGYP